MKLLKKYETTFFEVQIKSISRCLQKNWNLQALKHQLLHAFRTGDNLKILVFAVHSWWNRISVWRDNLNMHNCIFGPPFLYCCEWNYWGAVCSSPNRGWRHDQALYTFIYAGTLNKVLKGFGTWNIWNRESDKQWRR